MFNSFELRRNRMNKAAGAGIGVVIVLIAIAAFYMMNQSEESPTQVELDENLEMTAEQTKGFEVDLEEGVQTGDNP